jgi:hypothetical protein
MALFAAMANFANGCGLDATGEAGAADAAGDVEHSHDATRPMLDGTGTDAGHPLDGPSDATKTTDTGPVADGDAKDTSDHGETGSTSIDCPTTPCGAGTSCCADLSGGDIACEPSCTNSLACLKPSDCTTKAPVCCGTMVFGASCDIESVTTACATSSGCPPTIGSSFCSVTDQLTLCSSVSDCTDPDYPDCCNLPIGDSMVEVCGPTMFDSFFSCMTP